MPTGGIFDPFLYDKLPRYGHGAVDLRSIIENHGGRRPYLPRQRDALSVMLARMERMVTRQERIDDFIHKGSPPIDQPLQILCEDHVGTYLSASAGAPMQRVERYARAPGPGPVADTSPTSVPTVPVGNVGAGG